MLLECRRGHRVEYVFAGRSMKLEQEQFEAEMLGLHRLDEDPASGPDEAPASGLGEVPASGLVGAEEQQHFLLQYTRHSSNPWIQIESETEFLTRLARQAAVVWDMFRLTNLQVGLGSRRVTAREKSTTPRLSQRTNNT